MMAWRITNVVLSLLALFVLATLLAGCETTSTGSIAGGESKVFERPPYVVLGKRPYDQHWIDSQIEGGVAAFGWKRPAPRPAAIDAQRGPLKTKPASIKKIGIISRAKTRLKSVWPSSHVIALPKMTVPAVEQPAPFEPERRTPPVVVPRDPVDELLQPGN
jgi:hypothetical protein